MFGPTVVKTEYGKLRGRLKQLINPDLPKVEEYLGLQYASLVESNNRFSPPTSPTSKWDHVLAATEFKPVCSQKVLNEDVMENVLKKSMPLERVEHFKRLRAYLLNQAEDCLYLNVYVPYPS